MTDMERDLAQAVEACYRALVNAAPLLGGGAEAREAAAARLAVRELCKVYVTHCRVCGEPSGLLDVCADCRAEADGELAGYSPSTPVIVADNPHAAWSWER